jgi:hypothetical protein
VTALASDHRQSRLHSELTEASLLRHYFTAKVEQAPQYCRCPSKRTALWQPLPPLDLTKLFNIRIHQLFHSPAHMFQLSVQNSHVNITIIITVTIAHNYEV